MKYLMVGIVACISVGAVGGMCTASAADTLVASPNHMRIMPLDQMWDYFCVDNILYHGKELSIFWDPTGQHYQKALGLTVFENGKQIAHRSDLGSLTGTLE